MTSKKKRYRLRDLDVDRVDLVSRGANQYADIVIAKEDTSPRGRLVTSLEKHYGPGPHKNGTPQSIHGGGGGGASSHPKYGNVDTEFRDGEKKTIWSESAVAHSQLAMTAKRVKALEHEVYNAEPNSAREEARLNKLREKLYLEKRKLRSNILNAGKKVFPNVGSLDDAEKKLSGDDLDLYKFVWQNSVARFSGIARGYDITDLSDKEIARYLQKLYKKAGIIKSYEGDQLKNGLAPLLRNRKKKGKKKNPKGRKASGSAFPDQVAADSSDAP